MKYVVLVSHGEFAPGLHTAITMLGGEDREDVLSLATAANVIAEKGLLAKTTMIGGMNLPLVLTAVLGKDDVDTEELKEEIIEGAREQVKEFVVAVDDDDEEDL